MSTVTIIALAIVALSLILVVGVGIVSYSKAKPTLKNIQNTREVIDQKISYFTREGEHLKERVDLLNTRVQGVQKELEVKTHQFEDLTDEILKSCRCAMKKTLHGVIPAKSCFS